MPRLRGRPGPPPSAPLPPTPPDLSETVQLMRLRPETNSMEKQTQRPRSSNVETQSASPPTPNMRDNMPSVSSDHPVDGCDNADETRCNTQNIAHQESDKRDKLSEGSVRFRSREKSRRSPRTDVGKAIVLEPTSSSGEQEAEPSVGTGRKVKVQTRGFLAQIFPGSETSSDSKLREHSQGEDGGVSLKPLTPLPTVSEQQTKRPTIARKRGVSIKRIEAEQVNQISREEAEWMTEEPHIRNYAEQSQASLYGAAVNDITNTPMLKRYPKPTRDADEISRALHDMTVNDQDYQIGGPPSPVDIYNISYHSDISDIKGRAEFEHAREAKAFAGYAMFTERAEEVEMLRRLEAQGYLKEGVEIKYGYQEVGPHGSVAWLTHEGQRIGGMLREEYEQEKAETEARKQAEAEAEYYRTYEQRPATDNIEQLQDIEPPTAPEEPRPEVFPTLANRTPRSASPVEDFDGLIARIVNKRRGSDDSIKTVYGAGEQVPDSAYRSRPDLRPDLFN